MDIRQRRLLVPWLTMLAACEPGRPADFAGVVTRLDRGADRWTVSLESDARDTRHGVGVTRG
jgi:hypothetical protein